MATLTFKAVAPAVPTPSQWGSNMFVVSAANFSLDNVEDQSSVNPQKSFDGMSVYTFTVNDFTLETTPPFMGGATGESLKKVKIVSTQFEANADGVTTLMLNTTPIISSTIIDVDDIKEGKLTMISSGGGGGHDATLLIDLRFSIDGVNFPEETATIFRCVGARKNQVIPMTFKDNATLLVDQPITIFNEYMLNELFLIESALPIPTNNGNDDSLSIWYNMIGPDNAYKIEFQKIGDTKAVTYYGMPIVEGQKIQLQAFIDGNVKIIKDKLIGEEVFTIAFGNLVTGKFRLKPIII